MAAANSALPTVVLVHGAFAESASWNGVIAELIAAGHPTIAAANPLRGVASDAAYIGDLVSTIDAQVVLVGHSYGGTVITNVANRKGNIAALVYVAGFAPDEGETSFELAGLFPGATLGAALAAPVPLADGGVDLYIEPEKFAAQFAADVSRGVAQLMASTQRPIAEAAGNERTGVPLWKSIPSWFIYGDQDLNIPTAAQTFMANRAGAQAAVVVAGASHVVMTSRPSLVADIIRRAAGTAHMPASHVTETLSSKLRAVFNALR